MKILKICCNDWNKASRDKRELSVYEKLGAETIVLAKGLPNDKGRVEIVDGFKVHRYSTRPLGKFVPDRINRILAIIIWSIYILHLKPDVISCHSLPSLFIGWLSNLIGTKKAKLIYDSHEFELEVNVKRNKFQKFIIKQIERFLIKRCVFSIMVNDSIANEVQKIYSLKKKPLVLRNIPNYWNIDYKISREIRNKIIGKTNKCLLIFHGAILPNRGIEDLIAEIAKIENVKLLILGYAQNNDYLSLLKEKVKNQCFEKVIFHPAVPIEELWKYINAADIAIIPFIKTSSLNEYYKLPNKFFESIQSETPIISANYPEIKTIIKKYEIGTIYDLDKHNSLEKALSKVYYNKNYYNKLKNNLKRAKYKLCWEKEQTKLIEAYKKYLI